MDNIELTEREKLVLHYLRQGLKNSEISNILNISVHTTKAHLEAIYDKLGVHNRVQAVTKSISMNLVPAENFV